MALKIIDHGTPEYHQMIKLRDDILRKPLGLSFSQEELMQEKDQILIGAFDEDKMLGCCMLVNEGEGVVRLRQMAVNNNLQGKGIGRALMNFAENIARDQGFRRLTMHARKTAIGFYEHLGYQICSEDFLEGTNHNYLMEMRLREYQGQGSGPIPAIQLKKFVL